MTAGNALIGLWLAVLSYSARPSRPWTGGVALFGLIVGVIMAIGLAAVPGILRGIDSQAAAAWFVNAGHVGSLGWLLLYPIWCIVLGCPSCSSTSPSNSQTAKDWGLPMNIQIVYDTVHVNTQQLAEAMARALAEMAAVRVERAAELSAIEPAGADLLIVGGPTHRQRSNAALSAVLEATPRDALRETTAAAFDTRYRMSVWLSGSAVRRIARQLHKHGARLAGPPGG
jgi:hypothetical protein